jgi:hypothetical protein
MRKCARTKNTTPTQRAKNRPEKTDARVFGMHQQKDLEVAFGARCMSDVRDSESAADHMLARGPGLPSGIVFARPNLARPSQAYLPGRMTVSITWITPLVASMSAPITVAFCTMTLPFSLLVVTSWPWRVLTVAPLAAASLKTRPLTT